MDGVTGRIACDMLLACPRRRRWRSRAHARRLRGAPGADRVRGTGPGTWLREHTVATSLGLSRTPVREALRLLAAKGVVEFVHNRGARVVSWSAEDIDEAYRLRALIEGYGAGLAAARADAACVAELRSLQERYEQALDGQDPRRRRRPSATTISTPPFSPRPAAPGCPCWWRVSSAPLVRRVLHSYDDDDRRRSVMAHRDVITAIANGDADLATSAMSSHILAARYSALRS